VGGYGSLCVLVYPIYISIMAPLSITRYTFYVDFPEKVGLIFNLSMSVEAAFWPLKLKVGNI